MNVHNVSTGVDTSYKPASKSHSYMQEAWLQLHCPGCAKTWEAKLTQLPGPDTEFTCDACHETRPLSEFMKTARDLELLRAFQT